MTRKTTKKVPKTVVLEAFTEARQLSTDKIGEVVAGLVNDGMLTREQALKTNRDLAEAVNWSINTILATKDM
jgi:hypothetical protein|tara:strand:+ start:198 stop:413 length:216 start_codon:yes stop_codon:yes gene_type:complete